MSGGRRETTLWVIAYDIPDDKRRARVHKILRGFGEWTQYSLFECFLTPKERILLASKLERALEPGEDSVRFYSICEGCRKKVETVGGQPPVEATSYMV